MEDPPVASGSLSLDYCGRTIPVTYGPHISSEAAHAALASEPFQAWFRRCRRLKKNDRVVERLDIHSVELQSIDFFGSKRVGFVKLKSHCTVWQQQLEQQHASQLGEKNDDGTLLRLGVEKEEVLVGHNPDNSSKPLPGICFLRGGAASIFVALFGPGEEDVNALLVEQPRVPIGMIKCLELPAGMIDHEGQVTGTAIQELYEECGLRVASHELVDLTQLAFQSTMEEEDDDDLGIAPSPGGCDERVRYLYLEKSIANDRELQDLKGRLQGLRDHGELITLRVVPMKDVWKISQDAKAMISLFLLEKLRSEELLPEPGCLATPLIPTNIEMEPTLSIPVAANVPSGSIPRLAFGLWQVPDGDESLSILSNAIRAGYRHFDAAEYYGKHMAALGQAIRKSGIPRQEFFIATKVWKTALVQGKSAVQDSVRESLDELGFSQSTEDGKDSFSYFDLVMIHWPVPGKFVAAYQALQELQQQGIIKYLGLSNFNAEEYQELMASGVVTVQPVCIQMEVSPVMYRPNLIEYFQQHSKMIVMAFKPLKRGEILTHPVFSNLANKYQVTAAQLLLRWSLQHNFVLVCKTCSSQRMLENRHVWHFNISAADMNVMDQLTSSDAIELRTQHEQASKLP